MSSDVQRYRVNEPTVIQEIIDGEAIIADLGRGFYYSMDSLGSRVWGAIVKGCSVDEVIDACASTFAVDREIIADGIRGLLKQLDREQLIVPLESDRGETIDTAALFTDCEEPFTAPVLSKYTDMEQLLLLDPIHDVDETGWPRESGAEKGDQ
jgi:hypothetical protein